MSQHIWRGNGWRHHVISWTGGYIGLRWVGRRYCSEPTCEINNENVFYEWFVGEDK